MANIAKRENMTIAIREYQDNNTGQIKKVWKTIGELVTWDDGSQSFELWGPTGSTRGQVFSKDDNNQPQYNNQQPQYNNQQPQYNNQNTGNNPQF